MNSADRDAKFSQTFRDFLASKGAKQLRLPRRSPNLNAHLERFMKSIKTESLDRMIFFGEKSLRHAVRSYLEHYHAERNHQGLENELIEPAPAEGDVVRDERLGGLLSYYRRAA